MKIVPFRVLTLFLILFSSAACGRLPGLQNLPGSGNNAGAGSLCSNEYYPVAAGNAWEYRITIHQPEVPDSLLYQRSEIVEVPADGFSLYPNVSRTGEFATLPESSRQYVRWECLPDGLFLPGSGREGITVPKTMEPGSTWTTVEPGTDYEIVYTVEGREEVEVPAGTFEALKVRVDDGGEGQNIFKWYAPGVGLVKEYSEFEGLDTWSMLELLAYDN